MKRLPNFLLMMLTVVLLATFITSCSESGSDSDPSTTPTQPQTPVSDGDWQVVPATGGTIEKGDITITFPSGTFNKDTKIAITEVKKGETCGEYEASKFYQITMPLKIDKPFSVKIKSTEKANDIQFVASTLGYRKSSCDYAVQTIGLDGTYANGEYMLTLPATNRKEDDGSSYLTLGLAHTPILEEGSVTRGFISATQGKVGNIGWWYYIGPAIWQMPTTGSLTPIQDFRNLSWLNPWISKLNTYIPEAIKKIHDLGFRVLTERQIPIVFLRDFFGDQYAAFQQNPFYDEWSTINLNMEKLIPKESDTTFIKQTVIHELLHYYQADYGPSSTKTNTPEATMLSEAGSVWVEKLMAGGQMNNEFVLQYIPWFLGSLYDVENAWKGDATAKTIDKKYASHGYAMSTLLYYFTSPMSKKNNLTIDDTKIVEFYQLWDKHPGLGFAPIQQWLVNHKNNFLKGSGYEDFLMCLLSGELFPYKTEDIQQMINIMNVFSNTMIHYEQNITSDSKIENSFPCLTYGCYLGNYSFAGYKNDKGESSLKNKEIVIKQLKPKVTTYVIAAEKNKRLLKQLPLKTVLGDSIVINGEDFEQMLNGTRPTSLYTVTINCTDNTKEGLVSFEIRDKRQEKSARVSPTELTFPAEGGTQTATVSSKGYSRYNHKISDKYKEWLSAKNNPAGKMDITVQPNATGKERIGYVRVYVFNDENPTEAQKVYLKDSIKVTQAANKEPEQQESAYELVGGGVNMYYAVEWRSEIEFKDGDDRVTITPSGKGAKVQIQQSGEDTGRNAEWEYTLSFDVDDLSLYDSKQAKISNFKYEFYKEGKGYDYYGNHVDWEKSETLMTSNAPMQQTAYGNWRFESQDLSYYGLSITHFDKYRTDPYSSYTEHTDKSETKEMTPGSNVTIWLTIKKK